MGRGFSKIKKQAKQLEEQFSKMQEEMQSREFEGQAGSGLVKLTITGEKKLKSIKIDPECVDKDDLEALEDLIIGAYQDAESKLSQEGGGAGGMMPPGMEGLSGLLG